MQLTEHFSMNEMLRSDAADENGFTEQYTPPQSVLINLQQTCEKLLEPMRKRLSLNLGHDVKIIVTSGYRCARTNKAVGGVYNSEHLTGRAVDFHIEEMTVEALFLWCKANMPEYDELIQEFGNWVHISWRGVNNRNMDLRAVIEKGKTKYVAA